MLLPTPILPATKRFLQITSPLNSILSTFSHHAPPHAHHLFDEMPHRASSIIRALDISKHTFLGASIVASLHCLSLKTDAILELPLRTSVLTAYGRAGDVSSVLALFDETVAPDMIFWNATINACMLNCCFGVGVVLFRQMVEKLGEFDSTTMVIMLSGVSRAGSLEHGMALHGAVVKRCLDVVPSLCNALIDMHAKCGDFDSSELVFERMPYRDCTSWNSMISGSLFNGLPEISACYFREMTCSIIQADEVSLSCVLSACSRLEDLFSFGESVHSYIIKLSYEDTASCSVANSLITFYSEYGFSEAAEKVFVGTSSKNLVSWNAMIKGLFENERVDKALQIFQEMHRESQPDVATLVTIIPACGEQDLLLEGKSIHGYTIRKGLFHLECPVGNSLVGMYLKCDKPSTAYLLFRTMPRRDLISWNMMISGYSRNDSLRQKARVMFKELLSTDFRCSLTTLLAVIASCTCIEDLSFGQAVHSLKLKYGFVSSVSAVNALMHMYIHCGDPVASFSLIKSIMSVSDIVSWNTIIVGCVQNGHYKDALEAFRFMLSSLLINPDTITLVSILSACGSLNLRLLGKSIHCMALRHLLAFNVRVKNALLTMYFRCADTKSAELVFYRFGDRNLCSWNCMISGFTQNDEGERALQFYQNMEDFAPNEISTVGILCACAQLGDLRQGKEIHGHVVRFGLRTNLFISASLIDMYSKCGRLDIAVRVFEASAEKSIASWNSMISAYGFHGYGRKSIELFWVMNDSGIRATKSTFIALLSACSHSGLIDEGWKYYHLMLEKFGMTPTPEHHVCMVDMLGRARRLREAYKFVDSLPANQVHGAWGALLSACSDNADLNMAESIAKHLLYLEPDNSGYYITLSNSYAYHAMWSGAAAIRSMMQYKGLVKPNGHSMVE